jgi:hypothetical protein
MWHEGFYCEVGDGVKRRLASRRPQTLSNSLRAGVLYVQRLNNPVSKSVLDALV